MRRRAYQYGGIRAAEAVLRWAAFFDVAGWRWRYRALDLRGVAPTFLLTIPALDEAWVSVRRSRRFEELVGLARRDLERAPLEGIAVALGDQPLAPHVLGGWATYPRPRWEPLTLQRVGLGADVGPLWREATARLDADPGRDLGWSPEMLGGETLPDWRRRGEALARRWGSPEQARDWGLLISEIAQIDPLTAGVLAGCDRGRLTDESLDVWFPAASIRTALLRSLGARPRALIDRLFHVQLQVLVGD